MAVRSSEIGGCPDDVVRPVEDVLNRTLVLGAVVAASYDCPRDELKAWLVEVGLMHELTSRERTFLDGATDKQLAVNFSWQSERLVVLLWALNKIPTLPFPAPNVSIAYIEDLLPPYGNEAAGQFCATARLRSEDELFSAAHEIQELHVVARQRRMASSDYRSHVPDLDAEVVGERHHAMNWLVGYCGQSWDEVTTDT